LAKKAKKTTTRSRTRKTAAETAASDAAPDAASTTPTNGETTRGPRKRTSTRGTKRTGTKPAKTVDVAAPKAPAPAAEASARGGRRRRGATRPAEATPPVEAAAIDTPKPARPAAPDAAAATVTREVAPDGSVVIRFPPVAPPPFRLDELPKTAAPAPGNGTAPALPDEPETEAEEEIGWEEVAELRAEAQTEELDDDVEEVVLAEPPAPAAFVGDDEDEDEGETDEDEPGTTAAAAPPAASPSRRSGDYLDEIDLSKLTRSQRRRLRRKRRGRDRAAEGARGAEAEPIADEESEEREAAASVPPADIDAEPAVADEAAAPEAATEEEPAVPARRKRRRSRRRRKGESTTAGEAGEDFEVIDNVAGEPVEMFEPKARTAAPDEEEAEEAEEAEVTAPPVTGARQEMLINCVPRDECRIAIIEEGRLEEIYLERASYESHVGSIYKGVVTNVEASIQAAFVDFGLGKNGFLHITDINPDYFPAGVSVVENVGRKMPRRSRPPIQKCLRRGQEVIVQITKEGIGTKGPTLSTYLSIPGRFLVMMPGMHKLGISRKIEDDASRQELREQLSGLELPEGIGFIARTAAQGRTRKEVQNDLNYLARLWRTIERRIRTEKAPCEVYRESDLVIRTIRDMFSPNIQKIVVDDPEVANRAREFLSIFSPRSRDIVVDYDSAEPLFHKYGIEAELEKLHTRRVPLKSGGSLVIEATEALVAIDVNSGRFRTEDDAESTAFKINVEAAEEIARQLRLRDMGGVIVCDFIDMRMESHKREVERKLIQCLKKHKERAKVLRTSQFGLIELTRQRQRGSLTRSVYQDCAACRGTGLVKTLESVVIDALRLIALAATRSHVYQIELSVSTEVGNLLQNRKRDMLHTLETTHRRVITIKPDPSFSQDQMQIQCYDQRGRPVPHT
jgi:ribonuclease E